MGIFASSQLHLDYSPISDLNQSGSSNGHSPYINNAMPGQDLFSNYSDFQNNEDFSLFDDDLYSANVHQLPTPNPDIFRRPLGGAFETSGNPFTADPTPHISPVGHGNTMLYTPNSLREVDEGFEDFLPTHNNLQSADFQLFPASTGGAVSGAAPGALFGEIPTTVNFMGVSAQELLDFYAASTAAATAGRMDWASDDQFSGYEHQRH